MLTNKPTCFLRSMLSGHPVAPDEDFWPLQTFGLPVSLWTTTLLGRALVALEAILEKSTRSKWLTPHWVVRLVFLPCGAINLLRVLLARVDEKV